MKGSMHILPSKKEKVCLGLAYLASSKFLARMNRMEYEEMRGAFRVWRKEVEADDFESTY